MIELYNTAARKKQVFEPLDRKDVRLYVCGPTVYERPHLGNARSVVVFDTLFRLLRREYGAGSVTYVRNITDVDDKINARAAECGKKIEEITEQTIGWFHEDMAELNVLEPTHEPRATAYIGEMIAMIEQLIEHSHGYESAGHVLFKVGSYSDYGRLSGRALKDMLAGARVEIAQFKQDPMDFVLWKPSKAEQPGWDSPWGRGRPGWHIECSAMSKALLGETFDIHGGGNDLMFPHHENEIAQSVCAHPEDGFANFWMHNEMLQIEGKKMSKSLGNFFAVRDLINKGISGEVIRMVLLSTHYRKPLDWTDKKLSEVCKTLRKWRRLVKDVALSDRPPDLEFLRVLCDDLNTPGAISVLHRLAAKRDKEALEASVRFLGLLEGKFDCNKFSDLGNKFLEPLTQLRKEARASGDFSAFDRSKAMLEEAGVSVDILETGKPMLTSSINIDREQLEKLEALASELGIVGFNLATWEASLTKLGESENG